jgi:NAD(P)-dependent dehydrogenase (short-subunit alcohol dehydrogenase family)
MKVCLTGANRGLGLEFCRQLLERTDEGLQVFAAVRNPDAAVELNQLMRHSSGRLHVLALDVSLASSVATFARKVEELLKGERLNLLINNAGVFEDDGGIGDSFSPDALVKSFDVNAIGPMRVISSLIDQLERADAKIVNVSSLMGSLSDNSSGGYYAYRASKAALNMCIRSLAIDRPDFISVVVHPGWVQTDMGGRQAPMTAQESVQALLRVILGLKSYDSGTFKNYDGSTLPW